MKKSQYENEQEGESRNWPPSCSFLKKKRAECVIFVIRLGRVGNFLYICGVKSATVSRHM